MNLEELNKCPFELKSRRLYKRKEKKLSLMLIHHLVFLRNKQISPHFNSPNLANLFTTLLFDIQMGK